MVLRPDDPLDAAPLLERLEAVGLLHVEIAWRSRPDWAAGCRRLVEAFPGLRLGAASIRNPEGLAAALHAGLGYAMSPVLDPSLLRRAGAEGLTLVPGVFSPSEVHRARDLGCQLVKLFPAASLGAGHWRRLREPLGGELPFCIAAGGLGADDVTTWLEAGVDAVALGTRLVQPFEEAALARLLRALPGRSAQR